MSWRDEEEKPGEKSEWVKFGLKPLDFPLKDTGVTGVHGQAWSQQEISGIQTWGFPSCSPLFPHLQFSNTLPMFQLSVFLTHMNTNCGPVGDPPQHHEGKAVGNYLVQSFPVQRRG